MSTSLFAQSVIEGGSLGSLAAGAATRLGIAADATLFWIANAGLHTWLLVVGVVVVVGWLMTRR